MPLERRSASGSTNKRRFLLVVFLWILVGSLDQLDRFHGLQQELNINYHDEVPLLSTERERERERNHLRLGNGCRYVFLDVGANRGIQTRKLFEPHLFPQAEWPKLFRTSFGTIDTIRSKSCSFMVEPNPIHHHELKTLAEAYIAKGWRTHLIPKAAWNINGNLTYTHEFAKGQSDGVEVGSRLAREGDEQVRHGYEETIPTIDLAQFIKHHVLERSWSGTQNGSNRKKSNDTNTALDSDSRGVVLMKMDIEGAEFTVFPHLLVTGVLCRMDKIAVEWHVLKGPPPGVTHKEKVSFMRGQRAELKRQAKSYQDLLTAAGCAVELLNFDDESYGDSNFSLPGSMFQSTALVLEEKNAGEELKTSLLPSNKRKGSSSSAHGFCPECRFNPQVFGKTTCLERAEYLNAKNGGSLVELIKWVLETEPDNCRKEGGIVNLDTIPEFLNEWRTDNTTLLNPLPDIDGTAVICAIVKDELQYLDEWVDYNLALGFDKVYLYDNSNDFNMRSWRNMDDKVQVFHELSKPSSFLQQRTYNKCANMLKTQQSRPTWVAFFDPDEYLVLKKHANVTDFLAEHCSTGSVQIVWYMFGTNNQTKYLPLPVTMRFTRRLRDPNIGTKSLVKLDDLEQMAVHHAILHNGMRKATDGRWIREPKCCIMNNRPTNIAVLHHYKTKSLEENMWKECQRGDVKTGAQKCNSTAPFVGDTFDDSAWRFLKSKVPAYAEYET